MKKFLIVAGAITCLMICFVNGYCQDPNFVIPRNPEVIIVGNDGSKAVGKDVYSKLSKLKRSINIYDAKGNPEFPEVFVSLESNNPKANIYNQLDNDPSSFSGSLIFEVNGSPVYVRNIVKGIMQPDVLIEGRQAVPKCVTPFYNADLSCSLSTVHDCVHCELESMNWIRFGLCLLHAPACYLNTWINCTWEVCVQHMQYIK